MPGDVIVLDEQRVPRGEWNESVLHMPREDSIEIFIIDGRMEIWYGERQVYDGPPFKTLNFTAREE